MKTNPFIVLCGWWKRKKYCNGFAFLELLVYSVLAAAIMMSALPVCVQLARTAAYGAEWEEMFGQSAVLDETIYGTLRFCRDVTVTDKTIRCRDAQGALTGFTVKNGRVYKLLENGSEQPLTGTAEAGFDERDIYVEQQEGEPYFALKGDVISVRITLRNAADGRRWPCMMAVKPLPAYFPGNEMAF